MAELLENLFILKKSMCEGESNDLEEIQTEALLKEHLKEMKAKMLKIHLCGPQWRGALSGFSPKRHQTKKY